MANSEKTVRRAPDAAARRLTLIIFSIFPVKSPTVGSICARAIFTSTVYCTGRTSSYPRKSSGAGSGEDHADGAQNDLEIEPDAPVVDIGCIE